MRFLTFLMMFILFTLFSGCEIDTDESKRYEVLKLLDDGEFESALAELGSCDDGAFTEEECHLNRGMAYFGLAGYDITSIGEDLYGAYSDDNLSEDEQSRKIVSLVFDRFRGINMALGVQEYKKVLYMNSLLEVNCNSLNFKNLKTYSQQACIALNPVLLLEVIDDKESDDYSVDLEDLLDIERSVRGIAPNISSDEMADVLNGDIENLSENSKNELDATQCVITESQCLSLGMRQPTQIGSYEDLDILKVSKLDNSFSTLKLVDQLGSVVLVEENIYIFDNNSSCKESDYLKFDEANLCFPKPTEDTLTSKSVDKLNNDETFRDSLGVMLSVGDDEKSADAKVDELMTDICGYSSCTVTDENLVEYFKGY